MPQILIVDDHAGNRKQLRGILEKEGYAIRESVSGGEALPYAVREHPDLVLINAALPGKEGYRLCAELKQREETADIPVLLLSGWTLTFSTLRGVGLGVVDYISRPFNEREILARVKNYLRIRQLSETLDKTRALLMAKEREANEDLRSAALIQQSLLPLTPPQLQSFDFSWRFIPSELVGGDLFNVFKLDECHLGAYILDVSGHGVPAAMVTTSVAQALDPHNGQFLKRLTSSPPYYELVPPAEVLARLNTEYPFERFEKFFTLCYLLLDVNSGEVRYSNAAHPLPLLVRSDGRVEQLSEGGTIIGIGEKADYKEGEALLRHGDRLFLYTDGIVECPNARGEFFGEERLIRQLQGARTENLQAACARVITALNDFGDGLHPRDDITLLGIEYRQPPAAEGS